VSNALRHRAHGEHGFTLIEVLVSALLMLIISAGVATALISATDFTGHERGQSQANAVAQQDQERLKSMTDMQLTSLHQTRTVTLNGTVFTVVSTASFIDSSGNSSCTSKAVAYFRLTSTVSSAATAGNPAQKVTEETIITRPLGGSLVVPVKDQMSNPIQGAAVAVAGQNTGFTQSATTDQNGCVAFAGLPTDSYAITATNAGYVDPNGNASATETVGVTQSGIAAAPTLVLGPASAIKVGFITHGTSVTYDSYAGSPYAPGHGPAPAGYELSYYGAGNGSNMSANACLYSLAKCVGVGTAPVTFGTSTAVGTFTPGNLFPFYLGQAPQYTNNYQLWAGACEQEQPLAPLTGTGFATVKPGNVATPSSQPGVDAWVDEPAIDVAILSGGVQVVPSHVKITFSGKNSSGTVNCVDTWTEAAPVGTETPTGHTGVYGTYPAPFASQVAKGNPGASNTGDTGSITTVCADNGSKHGSTTTAFTTNAYLNAPYAVPVLSATQSGTC
jgi:prepilin-type N-terminal cleavage/methylation domain-containing protein